MCLATMIRGVTEKYYGSRKERGLVAFTGKKKFRLSNAFIVASINTGIY